MTTELEEFIRSTVRSELRKIFGVDDGEGAEWLDTDQAYRKLGYPSAKALRDDVNAGLLRFSDANHEREVRDRRKPGRKHARFQFHIKNCQKRLNEVASQRRLA